MEIPEPNGVMHRPCLRQAIRGIDPGILLDAVESLSLGGRAELL